MTLKYSDKNHNLVKYEETIQLYFDNTGTDAWLTLRNYGGVFNKESGDRVTEATFGTPASNPYRQPINIGAMLDAIDVIKFQDYIPVAMNKTYSYAQPKPYSRKYLNKVIELTLNKAIGVNNPSIPYTDEDPLFWFTTYESLVQMLGGKQWLRPPKGDKEGGKDCKACASLTISQGIQEFRQLGFTAYFPKPSLILQEERTALTTDTNDEGDVVSTGNGKTINLDVRLIKPVLSNMTPPPKFAFAEYIKELDKGTDVGSVNKAVSDPARVRAAMKRKNIGQKGKAKYLHRDLERICCFGFRGDTRDPQQIKAADGFLPGITRTDKGVAAYSDVAKTIDESRTYGDDRYEIVKVYEYGSADGPAGPSDLGGAIREMVWLQKRTVGDGEQAEEAAKRSKELLEEYRKVMRDANILDLGAYTTDMDFKGYISVTKSIAIAKHFANTWGDCPDRTTYCYAVRCRGGFELPSDITPEEIDQYKVANKKVGDFTKLQSQEVLQARHVMASYAEQEVAVAGAIFWNDVVGLRVIRCDKYGQFFCGPVFLQDWLKQEHYDRVIKEEGKYLKGVRKGKTGKQVKVWLPKPDDEAFSALFELFSGKSQGPGYKIEPSYSPPSYSEPPFTLLK